MDIVCQNIDTDRTDYTRLHCHCHHGLNFSTRGRQPESLACCIIRLIAFEMRLAISIKLSNWLMDSTESTRAVHAMDAIDGRSTSSSYGPPLLCRRNGWIIPVGTSMCDVQLTWSTIFIHCHMIGSQFNSLQKLVHSTHHLPLKRTLYLRRANPK